MDALFEIQPSNFFVNTGLGTYRTNRPRYRKLKPIPLLKKIPGAITPQATPIPSDAYPLGTKRYNLNLGLEILRIVTQSTYICNDRVYHLSPFLPFHFQVRRPGLGFHHVDGHGRWRGPSKMTGHLLTFLMAYAMLGCCSSTWGARRWPVSPQQTTCTELTGVASSHTMGRTQPFW